MAQRYVNQFSNRGTVTYDPRIKKIAGDNSLKKVGGYGPRSNARAHLNSVLRAGRSARSAATKNLGEKSTRGRAIGGLKHFAKASKIGMGPKTMRRLAHTSRQLKFKTGARGQRRDSKGRFA